MIKRESKLTINKDFLNKVKIVSLGCENTEDFNIDKDKIVDICFEATLTNEKKHICYYTGDGRLEIDKSSAKLLSSFADDFNGILNSKIEDFYLDNRLTSQHGVNGCDVCVLGFEMIDGEYINLYVPYDPLINTHGAEIELSNCPSSEILNNGNILLLFGTSSKSPKRIDNHYNDLIIGWEQLFNIKKIQPKIINMRI